MRPQAIFLAAIAALTTTASAIDIGGALPGGVTERLTPAIRETARDTVDLLRDRKRAIREALDGVRDTVGRRLAEDGSARSDAVDFYPDGTRAVHGEILATAPSGEAAAVWEAQGLDILRRDRLEPLGIEIVVLRAPDGVDGRTALDRLRTADPQGSYDLNHIYDPSSDGAPATTGLVPAAGSCEGCRIGVIDSGADTDHPDLRRARIDTRSFAGETPLPSIHGTAVAALLAGREGAARGANLFLADVYGGEPEGGSAEAIARALAWLATEETPVVTMSLAGPPNAVLQAAVAAMIARGHLLVAAVGNGGPAAPAAYPAAYPGVIGATAIDADGRPAIDAQRGPQVGFAAYGVNLQVPNVGGGETVTSGTSFAAPRVAARAAARLETVDPAAAAAALASLKAAAVDLGAPGRDDVFGDGALEPLTVSAATYP